MRSGYAPQTTGIPVAAVTVEGRGREAVRVSTVRELGGGGVPGMPGFASAEGTVEWAQLTNASSGPAYSPWTRSGNWPPAPGSSVQIDAGDEVQSFQMLTSVVDSSRAGTDGTVTSTMIDPVDRLHRRISIPAMLAAMPPLEMRGPYRRVGLSSDWIVDTVLRRCAFFTTPYMYAAMSGVSVPGQGSVWPEHGEVVTASSYRDERYSADFHTAPWGWAIHDCDARYTPVGTVRPTSGMEIACMVSPFHEQAARIVVAMGVRGAWFALRVTPDRDFEAEYHDGNTTRLVTTLSASTATSRVAVRISSGSMSITTDDGRSSSGQHGAVQEVVSAAVETVSIQVVRGGRIGGVIVGDPTPGYYLDYPLNARLVAGTTLNPKLLASPAIVGRDGLEVIGEIADATCRAYWWDEDGFFSWMPGDTLLDQEPGLTLTSRDNLLDLGWSEALRDTYRNVSITHDTPLISRSDLPNVTVWQGSGDTLSAHTTSEEVLVPPSNEEWVQVDRWPREAGGSYMAQINRGVWSVVGGVRTNGTDTWWTNTDHLTSRMTSIGVDAFKFLHTTGAVPDGQSIQLSMPNNDATTGLWERWRNEKLPIVRAYAKTEWVNEEKTDGSGPEMAAQYQHTGGRWLQGYSAESPGRVAAFLAQWLCAPRVIAEGVEVVHDPRIQVGDVHRIRDEHAHGVELTVLVTRVEQSVSAGAHSMFLDLFVISGAPAWFTLDDHDRAQPSTLGTHDSSESGNTIADHDVAPTH